MVVTRSASRGNLKDKSHSDAAKSNDKALKKYEAAPRSLHYEFGGIAGTVGVVVAVSYFSYFFAIGCADAGCPPMPVDRFLLDGLKRMQKLDWWLSLWDTQAFVVYLAWYAFTVGCWFVIPGRWVKGAEMRNGERLLYKENAFSSLIVTLAGIAGIVAVYGPQPLVFIYDHWTGLVTSMWLFSTALAFYVYASSFTPDAMLAEGGNTGNVFYDWFIGRELNPRIGSFDIKSFNELRPGLILWLVIDLAMAAKQYADLGKITDSMYLIIGFQSLYVFDALWNEPAILTTMDITTDGFGWMLSAGDLLWVPATYSLQARYLAAFPRELGPLGVAGVLSLNAFGYWMFRTANGDKDKFRNGKNPKNLESMETKRGTRLITSGLWGMSRHPNYLGDWLMSVAWCLPSGIYSILTFFYAVYFAVLLVHRQMRDDHACKLKYGDDWDRYCKLVKWRIIPYVY